MANMDITVDERLLEGLLQGHDGLAGLVENVLNQILQAQLSEALGAERYQRSDTRVGYRNGTRLRTLYTRVGPVTLRVPQTREGSFSTEIFARYQRSEQAFVLALMEMVVQGVSTRRVSKITEQLCGASFSKSTVSRLCMGLDARVRAFNERRLDGDRYPFVLVDAMFIRSRQGDRVVQRAALIVSGINEDGYRQILGVRIGDTESQATWSETFDWLKRRGLKGVMFVVSDSHGGLREALARHFQGASWQRCQVHLLRNVLGHCSRRTRAEVAEAAKLVLQAPSMDEARRRMQDFADQFANSAPKAVVCLQDGLEDAMAVMSLPAKYRRRLRTTNMMERQNREIRRRERVIGIFPGDDSAHRLIGALLAETNEQWLSKRYLDMDEFKDWRAEQDAGAQGNNVVALGE